MVVCLQSPTCWTVDLHNQRSDCETKPLRLRGDGEESETFVIMKMDEVVGLLERNQITKYRIGPFLVRIGCPDIAIDVRVNDPNTVVGVVIRQCFSGPVRQIWRQVDQINSVSGAAQCQSEFVKGSANATRAPAVRQFLGDQANPCAPALLQSAALPYSAKDASHPSVVGI